MSAMDFHSLMNHMILATFSVLEMQLSPLGSATFGNYIMQWIASAGIAANDSVCCGRAAIRCSSMYSSAAARTLRQRYSNVLIRIPCRSHHCCWVNPLFWQSTISFAHFCNRICSLKLISVFWGIRKTPGYPSFLLKGILGVFVAGSNARVIYRLLIQCDRRQNQDIRRAEHNDNGQRE